MQNNKLKFEDKEAKTTFMAIALIIILGFLIYANSLNGKFVWDDEHLIKENIYVKRWSNIIKIFTEDIAAGSARKYNFYRPLQMLTYMVDYSFWKLKVQGYHLTNVVLHILVALVLYWFINILFKDKILSFLTSIFFMVHPIHTEAVAYISGRADCLALLFILFSFIFYIKYLRLKNMSLYIFTLLGYILAILSRENSLIFPVLLLLYHYAFKERIKVKQFLTILYVTFIYILIRLTVLRSLLPHLLSSTTLLQRIPGFFVAIINYIRLILLPFDLHMEYRSRLFYFTDPKAILGIFILSFLLIYAFKKKESNSLIFFSVSWFFLSLLPVSNLYPLNIAYMAEHWLYVPSIGFFIILAKGLSSISRAKNFAVFAKAFIIFFLFFYSSLTIRQNIYWKEPEALYKRTLRFTPDSTRALSSLGLIYSDLGQDEEAIALYKRAIEINPTYTVAYNNLGLAYFNIGKTEEAITAFKKAIEIEPDCTFAYNNLGFTYNNIGKKEEAIDSLKKAISTNSNYAVAYNNLGFTYSDLGRYEEAIALYKQALELDGTFAEAYNNLGIAYGSMGKKEEAITAFKKAIEIEPQYAKVYYNLSLVYFRQKDYALAIEYCDKARRLDFNNLALLEALKPYRDKKE